MVGRFYFGRAPMLLPSHHPTRARGRAVGTRQPTAHSISGSNKCLHPSRGPGAMNELIETLRSRATTPSRGTTVLRAHVGVLHHSRQLKPRRGEILVEKNAEVKSECRRHEIYFVPDGTCLQRPKHPTAILSLRDRDTVKLTNMVFFTNIYTESASCLSLDFCFIIHSMLIHLTPFVGEEHQQRQGLLKLCRSRATTPSRGTTVC
jgi:hypothetical protein